MSRRLLPWLATLVGFWVLAGALLPVVQDEAYYALWGRAPALGYFDHPPVVGWTAVTGALAPGAGWALRLGTLALGCLTLVAARRFFGIVGLGDRRALWTAMLLAHLNVLGLVLGVVTTPDTALGLCWVVALSEAALALEGRERRWLTAGAATGLGLLAKYTMLLIGPVFLWALIRARRLSSPWPYLGGCVALLVLTPNLHWNAEHDWVTWRFQLRHGFGVERSTMTEEASLPRAEAAPPDGPEAVLAAPFVAMEQIEIKEERRPHAYDDALAALNRYVGYYGSQVALWGGLIGALALALHRRREPGLTALTSSARALVQAAAAVPLVVFGLLSLFTKVEANWSAMYVFGAAAWLTPRLMRTERAVALGAAVNLALGLLLVAHARFGLLPVRPHKDRLLKETHGYMELSARLAALPGPTFADTYQLAAMARFHAPSLTLEQWPGITRDSELTRDPARDAAAAARVRDAGSFWLVGTDVPPARIKSFHPVDMLQLRDCVGQDLQVISHEVARHSPETRCDRPIHAWYLTRYERAASVD